MGVYSLIFIVIFFTIVFVLLFLRLKARWCNNYICLVGKTVLITGANRGKLNATLSPNFQMQILGFHCSTNWIHAFLNVAMATCIFYDFFILKDFSWRFKNINKQLLRFVELTIRQQVYFSDFFMLVDFLTF